MSGFSRFQHARISWSCRRGWGAALLLLASCAASLARPVEDDATLFGTARDSQGPLSEVKLSLTAKTSGIILSTKTDAQGAYSFAYLAGGAYSLHATLAGHTAATVAFTIDPGESKRVDLTLAIPGSPVQAASAQPEPAFYDEPAFIVAGVTDSVYQGGHGSDAVMRSADALAKATASLGKNSRETAQGGALSVDTTLEALEDAARREPGNPELHHLLGEANERSGHALEAAHEYQRAAELDPSETNLFDCGTELLTHRADEPAIEVFSKGRRLYPRSKRMILGLASAWYARGAYDQAEERFLEATDLDPRDPEPYLFLETVRSAAIMDSDGYLDRLARFAALQPDNALANCNYAAALWKRCQKEQDAMPACANVEPLLEKATRLDPRLSAAYLQLGVVYATKKDFPRAISAYLKAIELTPELEEAHYRLAQVYRLVAEPVKAQEQIALSKALSKQSADEFARQRAEIQQFVIELKGQSPAAKP
jgi:tetratricopeptide (TPR) repeat protein